MSSFHVELKVFGIFLEVIVWVDSHVGTGFFVISLEAKRVPHVWVKDYYQLIWFLVWSEFDFVIEWMLTFDDIPIIFSVVPGE